jgi:site-specific DNA recombinase
MTRQQITDLVEGLGDMVTALPDADPDRKADVYRKVGLKLTYHPRDRKVRAEAHFNSHRIVKPKVSEGGLEPPCPVKGTSTSS